MKNPEFELLLACCTPRKRAAELTGILSSRLDWKRVFDLAQHHRVLPAVFETLRRRRDLPAAVQPALETRFQQHLIKTLRFSAELRSILQVFGDRGIEVLAHKGPVLAQYLFGDPAMRQFGDLDFLIRPADVARGRAALQELGYNSRLRLSPRQEKAYLHAGYEYVFGSAAEPNLIELQWQVVPRFYSIEFDMEAMFCRSLTVSFEGESVRMLRKEDLMLVLCVHAAKHEWNRLAMVREIATLAASDIDWDWIESNARRLGILRILIISLLLARDLLALPFPSALRQSHKAEWFICESLAYRFQQELRASLEEDTQSLRYFRTMMELREHWQDRARFGWRLAMTPNVGEWETVTIPDSLFPLYRGVRTLRLLRKVSKAVAH